MRVARAQTFNNLHLPSLAELIPRVALLDRPEHGFLKLFQCHVIGITNRREFLIQVIEGWIDRLSDVLPSAQVTSVMTAQSAFES